MEIQEVVRQDRGVLQGRVVLQAVRHDRQDCRELRDLQEVLGLETVRILQTDCQEGLGCWEA